MDLKKKSAWFYVFIGVLIAVLVNFSKVLAFFGRILDLIFPVLLGLILAFILNVPMKGFEKLLEKAFKKFGKKPDEKMLQSISLLLTLLSIGFVIALAADMLIPQLTASVKSIYQLLEEKSPQLKKLMQEYNINTSLLSDWLSDLDLRDLTKGEGKIWHSAINVANSTISGVTSLIFGMIIAIYVLTSKSVLTIQSKKLLYANLPQKIADHIVYMAQKANEIFGKFLSGQFTEAIILGLLIFIAYSLFSLPYAGLIGFLTAIFAFVPYVGAFASCALGIFLIFLAEPSKILLSVVVYTVVQFIENQFIYPHVVGSSVGLSALWTLIAALIGGKLFGLAGIIFFIPLTAFVYDLLREDTYRKLKAKDIAQMPAEVKAPSSREEQEKKIEAKKHRHR